MLLMKLRLPESTEEGVESEGDGRQLEAHFEVSGQRDLWVSTCGALSLEAGCT